MADQLTHLQREVAEDVLDVESAARDHLVVHLSGAHAYGFASPDSDLDLKAVHIAPTRSILGLEPHEVVSNRLEFVRDVEVDYTSNELDVAVRGLLRGDGNMLERVTTESPLRASAELAELRELALRLVSRRYFRHYRGFAHAQRIAFQEAAAPSAKKALYVLRTTTTGTHLLQTGRCNPDLSELAETYGVSMVDELTNIKRSGEKVVLPEALAKRCAELIETAFRRLSEAHEASRLPEHPPEDAVAELDRWVVDVRLGRGLGA